MQRHAEDVHDERVQDMSAVATPKVKVVEETQTPRVSVTVVATVRQYTKAEAFGSPSEARQLGAGAVDAHDEALGRLADA